MYFPKIDFSIPKKNSIILFDEINLKYIKKYINNNNYCLVKIRNKNVNFFAFIYALIFFYKSNFKIEYINFFLNFSKKKILISQNFNRLILYQLKRYYPDIKVIIIQNGVINNNFLNLLKKTKYTKLTCDYFCCFSDVEKIILQKYIKANFIKIGSIKNNFYKIKIKENKKELLYISQYRNNLINKKKFFNLYKNEKLILPIIYEFCQKKNIILSILPGDDNLKEEKMHYRKILNTGNFKIYERNLDKSYLRVDESLFSIGINRAITLIAEAKPGRISSSLIKDLGEHPEDKKPVRIMKGQYGPYIKYKSLNATIPEEKDPNDLTMEEALILIEKRKEYDKTKKKGRKK